MAGGDGTEETQRRFPPPPVTPDAPTTPLSSRAAADAAAGPPSLDVLALPARYRVVEELGHGGMGVVYRAHDQLLGRDVALKVLRVTGRVESEAIDRFQREARACATLDHPNIIRVLDVGTLADGCPFYTMELLNGRDLSQAIQDESLTVRQAVEAVRQISLALSHAHQNGILHRDIKPQNIFLRRQAAPEPEVHALILDFGLAKLSQRDLAEEADARRSLFTLTRSGQVMGTPMYMAPEQTRASHDVDARADVYSLGATLYHALTGRQPFEAATLAELLEQVQRQDPPPPRRRNPDVDVDLETLCLKCLQKEPSDRYASAGDLAEDCRRWLAGEPIVARPVGTLVRLWKRAKRNKAVAIPVAALLLVGLLAILYFGGGAVLRRVQLARWKAQASEALRQRHYDAAEDPARRATELSPTDRGCADLLAQSLAGKSAQGGTSSLVEYRAHRDGLVQLQRQIREASLAEKAATLAERPAAKAARWALEEKARTEGDARLEKWSEAVVKLTEAVTLWRDQAEARAGLAELYWDRYLQAEHERDRTAEANFGPLASEFGGTEVAERVRCHRKVRVRFLLPSAYADRRVDVCLYRFATKKAPPVLVPVPLDLDRGTASDDSPELASDPAFGRPVLLSEANGPGAVRARRDTVFDLRATSTNRLSLEVSRAAEGDRPVAEFTRSLVKGSYLLHVLPDQGLCQVRYPFVVARDLDWDETCEVPQERDLPPSPPGTASSGAGAAWVFIPAGPYHAGGDPSAEQDPPRDAAVVRLPPLTGSPHEAEGFYISHFEVDCAMYSAFLNDRQWHTAEAALAHVPRRAIVASRETCYWKEDEAGSYKNPWPDEWPTYQTSCYDAEAYCKWLTKTIGRGVWEFRLATEDEWEKAARGPDARAYPWGDEFDTSFCNMLESRAGEQSRREPEPYGLFPIDESPYGVRDLGGGAMEWTLTENPATREGRIVKGGKVGGGPTYCRAASRLTESAPNVGDVGGIRVVAVKVHAR